MHPRTLEGGIVVNRLKATDFPQEVLQLFDGYVHGWLSRTLAFFKDNLKS